MNNNLQHKIDRAIRLLRSIPNNEPIELSYSAGKDSDVILQLAKEAGINFRAIYRCTTIDPPGTIAHVKEMGVEIRKPKITFADLMVKKGIPSRYFRFCCQVLKEYKILDRAILGIRADESNARKKRYQEPELCRVYNAKEKTRQYLPILDWTKDDVKAFIEDRKIKCAPVYYDEQGVFHVERRLGCMCCVMASRKQRIAEFKKHPNMVKMYCNRGGQWLENHPDSPSKQKFGDIYTLFVRTLFYDTNEEFEQARNGLFGNVNCKEFLEDYFNIKL